MNARYLNCLLPRHVAVRACCLTYLVIVYDGGPCGHLPEARSLVVATLSPVVWDAPQMVYVTMAELSPIFYLAFSGFQLTPDSYPTHTRLIPDSYPGGALARESCRAHAVSSSFPQRHLCSYSCILIVMLMYYLYIISFLWTSWKGRPPGVRRRTLGDELRTENRQSMEKEMSLLGGGRVLCD